MVQHKRPHVITNPSQVEHLGATRASNNTGELSAVCHALTGAHASWRGRVRRCSFSPTRSPDRDLHHDWRMGVAQEQKALVERPQQESPSGPTGRAEGTTLGAVPARPSACRPRNERQAGVRLAAQGAQGMRSRGGRIYVPTDGDGRGHGSGVYFTLRPAGRATSARWIRCRTEGRRGVGRVQGRGGEGEDAWLRWWESPWANADRS
jgi:hypothetical protein